MAERAAGEAAGQAAALAALDAGVIDLLQAEALVALSAAEEPGLAAAARRSFAGELTLEVDTLIKEADGVRERLEDEESEAGLEELAAAIASVGVLTQRLLGRAHVAGTAESDTTLFATPRWRAQVLEALKHLREARDLVDDGMPADAAAIEMRAASDAMIRARDLGDLEVAR